MYKVYSYILRIYTSWGTSVLFFTLNALIRCSRVPVGCGESRADVGSMRVVIVCVSVGSAAVHYSLSHHILAIAPRPVADPLVVDIDHQHNTQC